MRAKTSGEQKPVPLRVKIMHLERRIINRQQILLNKGDAIGHNMARRLRSPKILLTAAAAGVLIGYLTKRTSSRRKVSHKLPDRRRFNTEQQSFMARLLKVIAMARAFLAAWPPGWLNAIPLLGGRSREVPVSPAPAPQRQSQSVGANIPIHSGNPNQIH